MAETYKETRKYEERGPKGRQCRDCKNFEPLPPGEKVLVASPRPRLADGGKCGWMRVPEEATCERFMPK
jgi:hypothetical protein